MNALRQTDSPYSQDALQALEWLDGVTERSGNKAASRVQLQGPDDQYQSWMEVEQHALPETPFNPQKDFGTVDDLSRVLQKSMRVEDEKRTPDPWESAALSQPFSASASPGPRMNKSRTKSTSPNGIPLHIQPLINFVVWRANHRDENLENASHYLLMTNDVVTQKQAQKFGVRAKMLSQVSGIVARETSRRRNHGVLQPSPATPEEEVLDDDFEIGPDHIPPKEGDEYDDEILFKGSRNRPSSFECRDAQPLLDPNVFSRRTGNSVPSSPKQAASPSKAKANGASPRTGAGHVAPGIVGAARKVRGSHTRGTPPTRGTGPGVDGNGNGKSPRGAGAQRGTHSTSAPTGPAAVPPVTPRGGFSPRGRAAQPVARRARSPNVFSAPNPASNADKPIDPDSYARPHAGRGRGRGNQHRLWDPSGR